MITRRTSILAGAGGICCSREKAPAQTEPAPEALEIQIGPGKAVTIRFPRIRKADLIEIMAAVLVPQENTPALKAALNDASSLTVVLSSEPRGRP